MQFSIIRLLLTGYQPILETLAFRQQTRLQTIQPDLVVTIRSALQVEHKQIYLYKNLHTESVPEGFWTIKQTNEGWPNRDINNNKS